MSTTYLLPSFLEEWKHPCMLHDFALTLLQIKVDISMPDAISSSPTASGAHRNRIWRQDESERTIYVYQQDSLGLSPVQAPHSSKSTPSPPFPSMPSTPTTQYQPLFQNIKRESQYDEQTFISSTFSHEQAEFSDTVHEPFEALGISAMLSPCDSDERYDLPSNVSHSVGHGSSRGRETRQSLPRTMQTSSSIANTKQIDRS
jgi:hypothetical protein